MFSSVSMPSVIFSTSARLSGFEARSLLRRLAKPLIPPRGFLISWATIEATSPMVARVLVRLTSSSSSRIFVRSVSTSTAPQISLRASTISEVL